MFNTQKLKCRFNCKSVSSTHTFVKGEEYTFVVLRHNDEDYECVLKFPSIDGELVDSRMFEDYDTSFIDEPYFEVKDTRTLAKLDKKDRPQIFRSTLCGGSFADCVAYMKNNFGFEKEVAKCLPNYVQGEVLKYHDDRDTLHSVEIEEIG